MAKIIKKDGAGYSISEYKIDWQNKLIPILRKRYSEAQTETFIQKICENSAFYPALRDEEKLKVVEENGEKVFYQLTRDGWSYRGKVVDFLIEEEQLNFIDSIVNRNTARELKEEVLRVQNVALDSLVYKPFYLLDEDGTTIPEDWGIYKAAKRIVTKYFSDECSKTVLKEVVEELFNTKNIENGSFVVLFDKKRTIVVADMQNVFPYRDDANLKMYIKETEPGINAEEFCRKIVEECISLPKTMRVDTDLMYVYKRIGKLELKKIIGEEEWQLTEESLEVLKKEMKETNLEPWKKKEVHLKCLPEEATFLFMRHGYSYYTVAYKNRLLASWDTSRKKDNYCLSTEWRWNAFLENLYD